MSKALLLQSLEVAEKLIAEGKTEEACKLLEERIIPAIADAHGLPSEPVVRRER